MSPRPPVPPTLYGVRRRAKGGASNIHPVGLAPEPSTLDTVQDFLIKLGIKPHMHLWEISRVSVQVEISILSLNNVIVRPTKIMNRADKNWAHF